MTKQEAKQAIDKLIDNYKSDLKTPLAWGCEDQINGIISGLKEAKKVISKITRI